MCVNYNDTNMVPTVYCGLDNIVSQGFYKVCDKYRQLTLVKQMCYDSVLAFSFLLLDGDTLLNDFCTATLHVRHTFALP